MWRFFMDTFLSYDHRAYSVNNVTKNNKKKKSAATSEVSIEGKKKVIFYSVLRANERTAFTS